MDAYGKLTVKAEGSGNSEGRAQPVYCALTTRVHHQAMKNRDDMSAVIEGLRKDHSLLVAFLEAADKIDWRALHRRVAICETPKPVNVEAHEASTSQTLFRLLPFGAPIWCGLPNNLKTSAYPWPRSYASAKGVSPWSFQFRASGKSPQRGQRRVSRCFLPKLGGPPRMAGPLFDTMHPRVPATKLASRRHLSGSATAPITGRRT